MRLHANSGRLLKIIGISYCPSSSCLQPISVLSFVSAHMSSFLSMPIHAGWRGGTEQNEITVHKAVQGQGPFFPVSFGPPPFFFLF